MSASYFLLIAGLRLPLRPSVGIRLKRLIEVDRYYGVSHPYEIEEII